MRLHKHTRDTITVFTRGEGYDCPPERGCWFEVGDVCLCEIEPGGSLEGLVPCPPGLCERDDHDHHGWNA